MSRAGNVAIMGQDQPLTGVHQAQHPTGQRAQPSVASPFFGPTASGIQGGYGMRNNGVPLTAGASLMQGYNMPMNNAYVTPGNTNAGTQVPGSGMLGANNLKPETDNVVNVWKWNLEEQFVAIQKISERYNYVSLDCKFPGIVARPIGTFKTTSEYHYQTLRSNVDLLQAIQIGLSFADEYGNPPIGTKTWQFNLHFNIGENMCSSEGIELLTQAGLDLAKHETDGIDPFAFGEFIISSGLVLSNQMYWITFHSGYDLGYLLSIMLNKEMPVEEKGFLSNLELYFPNLYDVKYVVKMFKLSTSSQLLDIADEFQIIRPGMMNSSGLNQAGSDAMTALSCFFEAKRVVGDVNLSRVKGCLFGLGNNSDQEADPVTTNSSGLGSAPHGTNVFQFGKMGGGGI